VRREAFIDFLLGVLDMDPRTRWTPRQAAGHPFITGAPFTGPYQPLHDLGKSPTSGGSSGASPLAPGSRAASRGGFEASPTAAAAARQQPQVGLFAVVNSMFGHRLITMLQAHWLACAGSVMMMKLMKLMMMEICKGPLSCGPLARSSSCLVFHSYLQPKDN
jgi:hypothetical protein